jgi:hypothetical protein
MEDAHGRGAYLRYWHPVTCQEVGCEIATAGEVAALARRVAGEYLAAGAGYLPGLALWRDAETPQNSLCLGIAPDGWAVIHTDEGFGQQVTRGSREPDGTLRHVGFDEPLEIPSVCFIAEDLALAAVGHWIESGAALDRAGFSYDLFSC